MDSSSVGGLGFFLVFGLIIYLVFVLSMWQIFNKAGEKGWFSIIPILNVYILTKVAQQSVLVFIMLYLPLLNIVAAVMLAFGLAKVFGKSALFAIFGLILFPYFGYMMLGWGSAEYQKVAETSTN